MPAAKRRRRPRRRSVTTSHRCHPHLPATSEGPREAPCVQRITDASLHRPKAARPTRARLRSETSRAQCTTGRKPNLSTAAAHSAAPMTTHCSAVVSSGSIHFGSNGIASTAPGRSVAPRRYRAPATAAAGPGRSAPTLAAPPPANATAPRAATESGYSASIPATEALVVRKSDP